MESILKTNIELARSLKRKNYPCPLSRTYWYPTCDIGTSFEATGTTKEERENEYATRWYILSDLANKGYHFYGPKGHEVWIEGEMTAMMKGMKENM